MTAHTQKDHDVRMAAHQLLTQCREPFVLDEFNLWDCRADIVSIHDDYMNGYELKSASDNLLRLPKQVNDYSEICKYSTLIVADTHLVEASGIIPAYWGLIIAHDYDGTTSLERERDPQASPVLDGHRIASLLWRDETLDILHNLHLDKGVRTKPKPILWDVLADHLSLDHLQHIVYTTIKRRTLYRYGKMRDTTSSPSH
jgi:hypothetical protein